MLDLELLTLLKVVIGPLLLAAGLGYGIIKYRQRGATSKNLTEETTRDLYRKGAQQERRRESAQESAPSPPLAPSSADVQSESWKQQATNEKPRP
jgi:hypothetical protein